MTVKDVLRLDATDQAALIRKKEITALELVEASISAIEEVNPRINAVIAPLFGRARDAAAGKLPEGPFSGVPFLMKDIGAMVAGAPMSLGTALLKGFCPDHDSELTLRYKRAGLVILGKTNTPEFGLLPTTEPRAHGPCKNPWDPGRTTGGSSGGSAAAVAAGMTAMAHANDGGGSIRIPASCCGLFGLKPTRARNPLGPDFGDLMGGLVCEHAVTRSVRDSAALLDATAGPDVGDPYWAPPPRRPFLEEVGADPGKLRIGFTTDILLGGEPHPDCVRMVHDAASLCEDLGHEVEEASPAVSLNPRRVMDAFITLWVSGCASTINVISKVSGCKPSTELYEPLTLALYEEGKKRTAGDYIHAVSLLQGMSRQVARWFLDYDLLLTPVLAAPPVPLGTFDDSRDPWAAWEKAVKFAPYTAVFNATGQPAMSVPLYWNTDGLPLGAHFVAPFGDEASLFALAAQLEQARPWAGRKPKVCV
ncbi:MAG: amidase [Proteobacteria bacterium]|nr:amidase [Pseudomonadota bacterium]